MPTYFQRPENALKRATGKLLFYSSLVCLFFEAFFSEDYDETILIHLSSFIPYEFAF